VLYMQVAEFQVPERNIYHQLGGSVFNDASFGFMPAFMDVDTSETHLSSLENGEPTAIHILDGLPRKWVSEWDDQGKPMALQSGVIAGFMRAGVFYTLSEIMNQLSDA
jgi:hypothetical protein